MRAASVGSRSFASRCLGAAFAAAVIVWLSLLLMQWMIRAPAASPATQEIVDGVQMVTLDRRPDTDTPPPATEPPPPPDAPPSLAQAASPAMAAPAISMEPAANDVAIVGAPIAIGTGLGLGQSGAFGGFAGRGGSGSGNGMGSGSGYGTGQGFVGQDLVPISTARPQMPDWACKKKIKGWVEAVFIVTPNGHVTNVRIIDAQPRGVYEAAAIDSISNWIYAASPQTREVKQRVEMDPDDCRYNWPTR
jgi:TonB family protein